MSQIPTIPSTWEPFGQGVSRWFGRTMLKLMGWRFEGTLPEEKKLIFAVAPHTSNWDFVIGLFGMFALGFKVHWLGKHTLFKPPFGVIMRFWGGIPVYRHAPKGFVEQVADQFAEHDQLLIAIAPEGTRSKVGKLKTGFLRMADAADVPVLLTSMDYQKKAIIFGELFHTTGDLTADERHCYEFFKQFNARFPEKY